MDHDMPPAPKDALVLWIIYDHPIDCPNFYVLRRDFILPGGELVRDQWRWANPSLESLRASLPPGLSLYPVPDPDPVILEVWL